MPLLLKRKSIKEEILISHFSTAARPFSRLIFLPLSVVAHTWGMAGVRERERERKRERERERKRKREKREERFVVDGQVGFFGRHII
jgi:hypothetical protein